MSGGGEVEFVEFTYEEMGVSVELPAGWVLSADDVGDVFTYVADGVVEDDGYAASIVVQREEPLLDDDLVEEAAAESLAEMALSYANLGIRFNRREGDRVLRSYEFDKEGRRVRQLQGLVADNAFTVITCTAPLVHADALEPVFERVVRSLRHVTD